MIRAEVLWLPVEALTGYQKVGGELQVRGVLREMLNDPEPHVRLRNLSTTPLLPGAPKLSGIPEGTLSKAFMGVISPRGEETKSPEEPGERSRQFVLVQGDWFTVRGFAEFPIAAETSLHQELLLRSRFFNLRDATVSVIGVADQRWEEPSVWVNRELVAGLYLG